MKQLFYYRNSNPRYDSTTNYIHEDYYGADNTEGVRKRLLVGRNNEYKTRTNTTQNHTDDLFIEKMGIFGVDYFAAQSNHNNVSAEDIHNNPVLMAQKNFYQSPNTGDTSNNQALKWTNVDVEDPLNASAPRLNFSYQSEDHAFRDGANCYVNDGSKLTGPENNADNRHFIVRNIDSDNIDMYRHAYYNSDGTVDWTNAQVAPYRHYDLWGSRNRNWTTVYNTRPYVAVDNGGFFREFQTVQTGFNNASDSDFSNDFTDATKSQMAGIVMWTKNFFQYSDYSVLYAFCPDNQHALYTNTVGKVEDSKTLVAWTQHTNTPGDYTRTYGVTAANDSTGKAVFTKTAHGFNNGDPVNVTSIDGQKLEAGGRQLNRGGVGHVYFVDRINNNQFYLTLQPHATRTRDYGDDYVEVLSDTGNLHEWDTATAGSSVSAGQIDVRYPTSTEQPNNYDNRFPDWNGYRVRWADDSVQAYVVEYPDKDGTLGTYGNFMADPLLFGYSSRDPLPMQIRFDYLFQGGQKVYSYLDANGDEVKTNAAQIKDNYVYRSNKPELYQLSVYNPQNVSTYDSSDSGTPSPPAMQEVMPDIDLTTDSNGYLTGYTVNSNGQFGNWYEQTDPFPYGALNANHAIFHIESKPNLNTPAVVSALSAAEDFDTHDYWAETDDNVLREWPSHKTPRSVNITVAQPGSVNLAQSGIKYVRNSGVVKYQLEFDYPRMREEDFAPFLAAAQAARGQFRPFYVKLRYDMEGIENEAYGMLFQRPYSPNTKMVDPRIIDVSTDKKVLTVDGMAPEMTNAVMAGQHIGGDSNNNGQLNTIIHKQDSNVFGETKFRLAYPVKTLAVGDTLELSPERAVVTLADNAFEYETDFTGLYTFKVVFDLDEFK